MNILKTFLLLATFNLLFSPLLLAGEEGSDCVLVVHEALFQTNLAKDFLAKNVCEQAKIKDFSISFTDGGLLCSGARIIPILPDVGFEAVLDMRCERKNQIRLLLREAAVAGVGVRWVCSWIVDYLEKKVSGGGLDSFFTISDTSWMRDRGEKVFVIDLELKPENIVKAFNSPAITGVEIQAGKMSLSVTEE